MKRVLFLATILSFWLPTNSAQCKPNPTNPLYSKNNCYDYSVTATPSSKNPGKREHCRFSHENFQNFPLNCKSDTLHIFMFECCLEKLSNRTLTNYRAIECLGLPYNKITTLQNRTFAGNSNLKKIYLSNNKIERIETESFYGLASLTHLDLSHNKLTSINEQVFSHCPNLEVLRLDGNHLTSVQSLFSLQHASIFSSLEDLSLSNNLIHSWPLTKLIRLTDLNLSQNRLTRWTKKNSKTMPAIKRLNLANNSLTEIERNSFESNRCLIKLDLSDNDLRSLEKDFVENLCSLTSINLSGNQLHEAHPEWFAAIARNFKCRKEDLADLDISLERNFWKCDCNFKRMKEFFKYLKTRPDYQSKDWEHHIKFKCISHEGDQEIELHKVDLNYCPNETKAPYLSGRCRESSDPSPLSSISHESSSLTMIFIAAAFVVFSIVAVFFCHHISKQKPKEDAHGIHENIPLAQQNRLDGHPQRQPIHLNRQLPPLPPDVEVEVIQGYMNA